MKTTEQKRFKTSTHLVFGNHQNPESAYFNILPQRIEKALLKSKRRRAVVFVERIDNTFGDSEFIQETTSNGVLYSRSAAIREHLKKKGWYPDDEELEQTRQELFKKTTSFNLMEYLVIDRLIASFRFRLGVRREWATAEELTKSKKEKVHWNTIEDESINLAVKGNFDKANDLYRKSVQQLSESARTRNLQIADILVKETQSDDPPVLIIGFSGQGHTQVFHMLKRRGLAISREFSDRREKKKGTHNTYLFDPFETMVRKLIFHPNQEITPFEWRQSLLLATIYYYIDKYNEKGILPQGLSDQDICAITWSFKKYLAEEEHIELFEKAIKEIGFEDAFINLENKKFQ